jgi:phosphate/sulfate permease
MKINNYIKYLLSLILLSGINIYAQASENLTQVISQAQQEVSNLTPPLNLSFLNPITSQLWYYFFNYGLTYLLAFGIITFLGWELLWKKEGEINRPLLLVFAIIAFFITYYLHATLIALAIFTGVILLFIWLYKLTHSVTGSIIGSIIIALLAYIVLTNGTNIMGFLPSSAFYILLFMFIIAIVIFGIRAHAEISSSESFKEIAKDIKYVYYKLKKPQDIKNIEESIEKAVTDIENKLRDNNKGVVKKINRLSSELTQILKGKKQPNQQKIEKLYNAIEMFFNTCDNVKSHIKMWKNYINRYYEDPIKSRMLNFLKIEEQRIDHAKYSAWIEYSQKILRNQQKVQLLQSILGGQRQIKAKP